MSSGSWIERLEHLLEIASVYHCEECGEPYNDNEDAWSVRAAGHVHLVECPECGTEFEDPW